MLDHAREARTLIEDRTRSDLEQDRTLQLALVRLLEILGEAANRVPPEVQGRYDVVPWGDVVALRNRLIHAYDAVDLGIVWRITEEDVPPLIRELEAILEELDRDGR